MATTDKLKDEKGSDPYHARSDTLAKYYSTVTYEDQSLPKPNLSSFQTLQESKARPYGSTMTNLRKKEGATAGGLMDQRKTIQEDERKVAKKGFHDRQSSMPDIHGSKEQAKRFVNKSIYQTQSNNHFSKKQQHLQKDESVFSKLSNIRSNKQAPRRDIRNLSSVPTAKVKRTPDDSRLKAISLKGMMREKDPYSFDQQQRQDSYREDSSLPRLKTIQSSRKYNNTVKSIGQVRPLAPTPPSQQYSFTTSNANGTANAKTIGCYVDEYQEHLESSRSRERRLGKLKYSQSSSLQHQQRINRQRQKANSKGTYKSQYKLILPQMAAIDQIIDTTNECEAGGAVIGKEENVIEATLMAERLVVPTGNEQHEPTFVEMVGCQEPFTDDIHGGYAQQSSAPQLGVVIINEPTHVDSRARIRQGYVDLDDLDGNMASATQDHFFHSAATSEMVHDCFPHEGEEAAGQNSTGSRASSSEQQRSKASSIVSQAAAGSCDDVVEPSNNDNQYQSQTDSINEVAGKEVENQHSTSTYAHQCSIDVSLEPCVKPSAAAAADTITTIQSDLSQCQERQVIRSEEEELCQEKLSQNEISQDELPQEDHNQNEQSSEAKRRLCVLKDNPPQGEPSFLDQERQNEDELFLDEQDGGNSTHDQLLRGEMPQQPYEGAKYEEESPPSAKEKTSKLLLVEKKLRRKHTQVTTMHNNNGRKNLNNAIKCYLKADTRKEYLTIAATTGESNQDVYDLVNRVDSKKLEPSVRKSNSFVASAAAFKTTEAGDEKKRSVGQKYTTRRQQRRAKKNSPPPVGTKVGKSRPGQNQSATQIPQKLRLKSTGSVGESITEEKAAEMEAWTESVEARGEESNGQSTNNIKKNQEEMKVGKTTQSKQHGGDLYRTNNPTKRTYEIQNLEGGVGQKNVLVRPFHQTARPNGGTAVSPSPRQETTTTVTTMKQQSFFLMNKLQKQPVSTSEGSTGDHQQHQHQSFARASLHSNQESSNKQTVTRRIEQQLTGADTTAAELLHNQVWSPKAQLPRSIIMPSPHYPVAAVDQQELLHEQTARQVNGRFSQMVFEKESLDQIIHSQQDHCHQEIVVQTTPTEVLYGNRKVVGSRKADTHDGNLPLITGKTTAAAAAANRGSIAGGVSSSMLQNKAKNGGKSATTWGDWPVIKKREAGQSQNYATRGIGMTSQHHTNGKTTSFKTAAINLSGGHVSRQKPHPQFDQKSGQLLVAQQPQYVNSSSTTKQQLTKQPQQKVGSKATVMSSDSIRHKSQLTTHHPAEQSSRRPNQSYRGDQNSPEFASLDSQSVLKRKRGLTTQEQQMLRTGFYFQDQDRSSHHQKMRRRNQDQKTVQSSQEQSWRGSQAVEGGYPDHMETIQMTTPPRQKVGLSLPAAKQQTPQGEIKPPQKQSKLPLSSQIDDQLKQQSKVMVSKNFVTPQGHHSGKQQQRQQLSKASQNLFANGSLSMLNNKTLEVIIMQNSTPVPKKTNASSGISHRKNSHQKQTNTFVSGKAKKKSISGVYGKEQLVVTKGGQHVNATFSVESSVMMSSSPYTKKPYQLQIGSTSATRVYGSSKVSKLSQFSAVQEQNGSEDSRLTFERQAREQVLAFVHPTNAVLKLQEQLTQMIYKNVQSMVNQEMDSREVAREKEIIRKSLKGKTFEEMEAARIQQNNSQLSGGGAKDQHRSSSKQHYLKSSKKQLEDADEQEQVVAASMMITAEKDKSGALLPQKKQSTIVLSFRSQDKFIKRAANALGWVQNAGHGSHLFNVKWEFSDSNQDVYKQLRSNQFYNHFPDSRELTTKKGLNQNLHNITLPGVDIYNFYPRCYDLSDQRQVDLFQDDFNRTAILSCLKKHAKYFKAQCSDLMKEIEAKDTAILLTNKFTKANKRQLKRTYIGKFPPKDTLAKVNTILLRNAVFYARQLLLSAHQDCEGDEFIKQDYYEPNFRFNQRILNFVVRYSELSHPIDPHALFRPAAPTTKTTANFASIDSTEAANNATFQNVYPDVFAFRGWEIPNFYVMYQAYKMHKELKRSYPQYANIDGTENVWICKPSFTARGVGIFCFRRLRELFAGQDKKNMCPKIVQKYVERSFVLQRHALPQLNNHKENDKLDTPQHKQQQSLRKNAKAAISSENDRRKFDIRQWVYVNSFDPLHVFIYKKVYLRICGADFDLSHFEDPQRHISNYSVQKDAELVLSSDDFIAYLRRVDPGKYGEITWESFFLPQIDEIVKHTLMQMAEAIQNRPNSFELFGFDFVVDKDLKLWLIEVNMSPACSERQTWLTEMLNDMATGVVKMVQGKVDAYKESKEFNLTVTPFTRDIETAHEASTRQKVYTKLQKEYLEKAIEGTQWISMSKCDGFVLNRDGKQLKVKIPQSQTQVNINPNNFEKQNLELIGQSANLKVEKFMDHLCRRVAAVNFIQKFYRGHRVRKRVLQQRILRLKVERQKKQAARVLLENLELAFDREKERDRRDEALQLLRQVWLDCVANEMASDEQRLAKVVKIQENVRKWLKAKLMIQAAAQNNILQISSSDDQVASLHGDDEVMLTGEKKQRHPQITITENNDFINFPVPAMARTVFQNDSYQTPNSHFGMSNNFGVDPLHHNSLTPSSAIARKVIQTSTSIDFQNDDRVAQRGSYVQALQLLNNSGAIDVGESSRGKTESAQSQLQSARKELSGGVGVGGGISNGTTSRHRDFKKERATGLYQLDSYLLLDYRAVGVDIVMPMIEERNGCKRPKGAITAHGHSSPRIGLKLKSVANNNYTFSPRYDCQQTALVTLGFSNGKPNLVEKYSSNERRPNQARKIKNQILAAYMDKNLRVRQPGDSHSIPRKHQQQI